MAKVLEFYGGEDRTAAIKVTQAASDGKSREPFPIALGSTVTVRLPASGSDISGNPITEIIKDNDTIGGVTVNNYDRGELSIILDDADTTLMKSGDIIIEIQSGSITRKARIAHGAKKLKL